MNREKNQLFFFFCAVRNKAKENVTCCTRINTTIAVQALQHSSCYTCYIHTIVYLYIYMEKRKANPKGTLTRIREQFNNHNAWLLIVHFQLGMQQFFLSLCLLNIFLFVLLFFRGGGAWAMQHTGIQVEKSTREPATNGAGSKPRYNAHRCGLKTQVLV